MRPLRLFALLAVPVLTGAWAFQAARPNEASILVVRSVDPLGIGMDDAAWGSARPALLRLSPPSPVDEVEVRAIASRNELAFLLQGKQPGNCAVILQFPLDDAAPSQSIFGNASSPVRLWTIEALKGTGEMITTGEDSFRAVFPLANPRLVEGLIEPRDGGWRALLRGKIETPLARGDRRRYSVVAWDRSERDLGMSVSPWETMSLEEGLPLAPLARAASAVAGALLLQWVLLDSLRRVRARC